MVGDKSTVSVSPSPDPTTAVLPTALSHACSKCQVHLGTAQLPTPTEDTPLLTPKESSPAPGQDNAKTEAKKSTKSKKKPKPKRHKRKKLILFVFYLFLMVLYTALGALIFWKRIEYAPLPYYVKAYMSECGAIRDQEIDGLLDLINGARIEQSNATLNSSFDEVQVLDVASDDNVSREAIAGAFGRFENCYFSKFDRGKTVVDLVAAAAYSITVYTTMGYGDIVSVTALSRILTFFYAILGIPIYIAFLSDLGDIIGTQIVHFGLTVRNCVDRRIQKRKLTIAEEGKHLSHWIRFLLISFVLLVYFILISLVLFYVEIALKHDDWKYLDTLHFVFGTVTLIGFGDIVPNHTTFVFLHFPLMIVGQTLCALTFYFVQRYIRYEMPHQLTNACLNFVSKPMLEEPVKEREPSTPNEIDGFDAQGAHFMKVSSIGGSPIDGGNARLESGRATIVDQSPANSREKANVLKPENAEVVNDTGKKVASNDPAADRNVKAMDTNKPSNATPKKGSQEKPKNLAHMFIPCHVGQNEEHSDTISLFAKYKQSSPNTNTAKTDDVTQHRIQKN